MPSKILVKKCNCAFKLVCVFHLSSDLEKMQGPVYFSTGGLHLYKNKVFSCAHTLLDASGETQKVVILSIMSY